MTVRIGWPPFAVWQGNLKHRRSPYYAASQLVIRMIKFESRVGYQGCLDHR